LALALAGGCKKAEPPPERGPAAVTVAKPLVREVTDWDVYPGRLAAAQSVAIRARVGGFVVEAPFHEGAVVKKGDLLFVIDERPYKVALDQATADLAQAQANARAAEDELRRIEPLRGTRAVAETEFVSARRAAEQARGAVQSAQAKVDAAKLDLEWCRVTAPITGKVSRIEVTPGNLITGGSAQGTLLTSITSVDPMYCYVNIDENAVRNYQRIYREQGRPSVREAGITCQLRIGADGPFDIEGKLDFVDNQVDPATGTLRCRGSFRNESGLLLPNFYAEMRIPGRGPYQALLVPEEAIGTTQAQRYVLTVGPDSKAQYRVVTVGEVREGLRAVEGIGPDDRVIVKGITALRPGAPVKADEVPVETLASRGLAATTGPTTRGTSTTAPAIGADGRGSPVAAPGVFGPANTKSGPAGAADPGRGTPAGTGGAGGGAGTGQQGGGVSPGGATGQGSPGGAGR